ncbi:MAG: hypothetical protein M1833_005925 [Piccolia ochrophora]|nr:MAG: hypothetical protein M1833_005925 [Piccolia ochrophora]
MARLNEPPATTESLDALKRRFIRQNREIARENSTKALRIRSLESDTSRLLSENIALREQIIKLQAEVDRSRAISVFDDVEAIQKRLQRKVREFGALVGELGVLQYDKKAHANASRSPRAVARSPQRSPEQRNWKTTPSLSEIAGNQDGRLPTIAEGKHYPRRSLNGDETLTSRPRKASATEASPSPRTKSSRPPSSHATAATVSKTAQKAREDASNEVPTSPTTLPANLETRRKRRDTANVSDIRRPRGSETTSSDQADADAGGSGPEGTRVSRTGSKRKFEDSNEVIHDDGNQSAQDDEFKFNRASDAREKDAPSLRIDKGKVHPTNGVTESKVASSTATKGKLSGHLTSRRKALGPKSTNVDPTTSPGKTSKTGARSFGVIRKAASHEKTQKGDNDDPNSLVPLHNPKPRELENVVDAIVLGSADIQEEPETPAGSDLFSPPSSQPSTTRPESRDTPPPADLAESIATADALAAGRAARRQRSTVNYAEPNLRDKMRRPTKELVDAVTVEARANRGSSVKLEGSIPDGEEGNATTYEEKNPTILCIKTEAEDDMSWKDLPTKADDARPESPLTAKAGVGTANLHPNIITQRRHRTSIVGRDDDSVASGRLNSTSAIAISALMAGSKRAKAREGEEEEKTLTTAMSSLDVGDSPGTESLDGESKSEGAPSGRSTKRQTDTTSGMSPPSDDNLESQRPTRASDRRRQTLDLSKRADASMANKGRDMRSARSEVELRGAAAASKSRLELRGGSARRRSTLL